MNRRTVLAGLLATAAPIRLPAAARLSVYGRSPGMDALPDMSEINAMVRSLTAEMEHVLLYGDPDAGPTVFRGLTPAYNAS